MLATGKTIASYLVNQVLSQHSPPLQMGVNRTLRCKFPESAHKTCLASYSHVDL